MCLLHLHCIQYAMIIVEVLLKKKKTYQGSQLWAFHYAQTEKGEV